MKKFICCCILTVLVLSNAFCGNKGVKKIPLKQYDEFVDVSHITRSDFASVIALEIRGKPVMKVTAMTMTDRR